MKINFKTLFASKKKPDVIEDKETQYSAIINNRQYWYNSKEDMISSIEEYSKNNVIFSLNMFRFDIYNLLK